MTLARFVDLGLVEPALFHASYAGIAAAAGVDAVPVVLWGRAGAHIALGASQDPGAEVVADPGVPVIRRPLGGGAVWVDEEQYCYVLMAPRKLVPPQPARWFDWGLAPAIETYRHFGLRVVQREHDLWLEGRKIAGSGAGTIGHCAVLASSFLLRFPVERFARCVLTPSRQFREWMLDGLRAAMTDWCSHAARPEGAVLRQTFREAVSRVFGWQLVDSDMSTSESRASEEALAEQADGSLASGRRLVADGVKLNAALSLVERTTPDGRFLCIVREGEVVKQKRVPA